MEDLTVSIKTSYLRSKETDESRLRRRDLVERIESIVLKKYPNNKVLMIGSSSNGFGTNSSDLDLTILHLQRYGNPFGIVILTDLEKVLKQDRGTFKEIELISGANVPIITFEYELGYCRFSCDVSIDRLNNVFNAVLLKAYTELDDRVQPLTIGLKKWAHAAKIIDPRNFKIGSFTLTLMVIHYLQCGCSPSVLPSLQKLHPSIFDTSKARELTRYIDGSLPARVTSYVSANKQSIGALFFGFFQHYSNFLWHNRGISIRSGEMIFRPRKRGSNNTCIYVEDPYELNSNTARSVFREYVWSGIKGKFSKAKTLLENGATFESLLANA